MRKILSALTILLLAGSVAADDIAVTVYNSNVGVVSENRTIEFKKGINEKKITDIPERIDPGSVRFELNDNTGGLSVLEQNYAYDLMNPDKMFAKYIDREIDIIDDDGQLISGTLLSYNRSFTTIKDKNGKILMISSDKIGQTVFEDIPDGMITRPTLFWICSADKDIKQQGNLTYQTSGLNWKAEYVGFISENDDMLDLSGWASINNGSGMTYNDATLKLIAGDINRIKSKARGMDDVIMLSASSDRSNESFSEKSFFEYHMYTLPRKATILDKTEKQISLFEPASTKLEKLFKYRPDRNKDKVEVDVRFINSEKDGLGIPLPSGRVRLFKADTDGSKILLGEDYIDHTPKNEKVDLTVGYAFDITANEEMMNQNRISNTVNEQEFKIELNNRKDEPVEIEIEKNLYGVWEIISSDFEYVKKNANTITASVNIPADDTLVLNYKVRFSR